MLSRIRPPIRRLFTPSQVGYRTTTTKTVPLAADEVVRGDNGCPYKAITPIREDCPNVWLHDPTKKRVLKMARPDHYQNEVDALNCVQDHPSFRRMLDAAANRHIIVLEHLHDNMQAIVISRPQRRLERMEAKLVAKSVLEGLMALHEVDRAHTDIKPDNILVNFSDADRQCVDFRGSKLCDLGGSVQVKSSINHVIGAPAYRAPEVNLGLPWTIAVDIWAFGATLLYLLTSAHFFNPPNLDRSDESFIPRVLMNQFAFFGPHPEKYSEIANSVMDQVEAALHAIEKAGGRMRYQRTLEYYLHREDIEFLHSFMKVDPRYRPSAKELLNSSWFNEARSHDS